MALPATVRLKEEKFFRDWSELLLSSEWRPDIAYEISSKAIQPTATFRWLKPAITRMFKVFPPNESPTLISLRQHVSHDKRLRTNLWNTSRRLEVSFLSVTLPPPEMNPRSGIVSTWSLPQFTTNGQLADWLGSTVGELDWFADRHGRERRHQEFPLRHYRYHWLEKANGSRRLIEAPKPRLKAIQRQLLDDFLVKIPVHPAAHAYVRERSPQSCAQEHIGRDLLLKLDLEHFFSRIHVWRIRALFRWLGYPEPVAATLAGLVTNSVPATELELLHDKASREGAERHFRLLTQPHLPQGAPTSPLLANLICYRLDCRLSGLAKTCHATYTRYADDLFFSGDRQWAKHLVRFRIWAQAILIDEGFRVRHHKTRWSSQAGRQQMLGLVVNEKLNPPRKEFDALRAELFNCARHGPDSQNREGHPNYREHLLGRVRYVLQVNPRKGERLMALFDEIGWT